MECIIRTEVKQFKTTTRAPVVLPASYIWKTHGDEFDVYANRGPVTLLLVVDFMPAADYPDSESASSHITRFELYSKSVCLEITTLSTAPITLPTS